MTTQPPNTTELFSSYLTDRQRVMNAVAGIIPTVIALPFILNVWSPGWFALAWVAVYLAVSCLFMYLVVTRPSERVEQLWSICISAVFCAVPITAVAWSDRPEDFWAATTVGVVFIAFEMSALPFLKIREWRLGVLMMGVTVIACGLTTVNPIVALAFGPAVLALVHGAERMRKLKDRLQKHLEIAEGTIRHDPLTGLLNRRGLTTVIDSLADEDITVAMIDVDHFKLVNDTHGHQVGDQVLIALGQELRGRLGQDFELARLGGDEFVAVAPGYVVLDYSLVEPVRVTTEIHSQTFTLGIRLSAGVSSGHNGDSAHRLLSEAGFAMRESKRSGATLSHFGSDLAQRHNRTLQVAAMAGGNADNGVFVPVAQTIISGDQIIGCELLIRWHRPDGEVLSPAEFLPQAAEAGLMSSIDDLMLGEAIRFAARFNNRPNAPFVSVNISAPHLGTAAFRARVRSLLEEHRVPAERLTLEITETEQFGIYEGWESTATELRALGVNLAIDDFGTGYSTIERLQNLPITHLKFDRSLVQAVSGPFGKIVLGVVEFAKAVNIGIIAEGIETLDEFESMRALNISMFQGYLFHRPESLDAVEVKIIESHISERERAPRDQPSA